MHETYTFSGSARVMGTGALATGLVARLAAGAHEVTVTFSTSGRPLVHQVVEPVLTHATRAT